MTTEAFVDGAAKISMIGGVVRLTLGELERDSDTSDPVLNEKLRLFMPLDGFLRTFATMQNVIKQMEKDGVISAAKPQEKPFDTGTH